MTPLKAGDKAPAFSVQNQAGETVTLHTFSGKKLILFFYPKDNTPGCTAEACNFNDHYAQLQKQGFEVAGVSVDTVKKHQSFIAKYGFAYPLLADTEKIMVKDYGVWGKKKFMGREYEGIFRTTFVINEKGIITLVITDVDTKNATEQLTTALKSAKK